MNKLNISVFVNGDLEVGDGGLFLWDAAAAGDGGATILGNLTIKTITLSQH